MKLPAIPDYVTDHYVRDCITDCVRLMRGNAPWWLQRSCLNCAEALELIALFLICVDLDQKRNQPSHHHKRSVQPNQQFNLQPVIRHLSYTLARLGQLDIQQHSLALAKELAIAVQLLSGYLKDWHNIDSAPPNEQILANVS